jgi:hypothetical protein
MLTESNEKNNEGCVWTEMDTIKDKKYGYPKGRYQHQVGCYKKKMYIFGGKFEMELFDDVWSLDLESLQWSLVLTNGQGPSPRYFKI